MKQTTLALALASVLLGACAPIADKREEPVASPTESPEIETVVEEPTRPFPGDSFHDLLVAEFAIRRNRFDLALGNYMQQAHETQDPGVAAWAARLAQFLKADNAALDAAQLWTDLEPDNLEGQYTLSMMLAKQGRPLEALQPMVEVLENGGQTNFADIAASAFKLDDPQRLELERAFDEKIAQYPNNAQLLKGKALLLQQRGETDQALRTIRKVIKLDPEDLHAMVVEARLLQELDREAEAFDRLEDVVNQHPHNRRLRLQYARMLMSRDIEAAKGQFELLLVNTPNDADLLLSLGLINHETGHVEEARGYFLRLLETGQRTQEAHYYLGQIEEQEENWGLAMSHYRQIPPGKDYVAALTRITAIYLRQGQLDLARDNLRKARSEHPEHALQLYLLEAEVLNKSQLFQDGVDLLTEALLVFPSQPNLLYVRSMLNEKLGRFDQMENDLQLIIDHDPDNAVALNALGYILVNRSQRLDDAFRMISRALELKPNDPAILDSLGWAEYRRGNLKASVDLLTRAFKAFPDHEVASHLGEVLWVLGEQRRALEVWKMGLERTPNSPLIRETVQRLGVDPDALPLSDGGTTAP